jgi:hypothetical protein
MQRLFSATGPPLNLVAAVHAHRQAQWQVGHGFLGLPNRAGYSNCEARQEGSAGKGSPGTSRLLLGCAAQPPATACGVGMHLGGHGGRQRLRGAKRTADPSDDGLGASGGWGAGAAGRTSTGATCAISASTRGLSGAQSSPLYMQRPSASTYAEAFQSPRSNTAPSRLRNPMFFELSGSAGETEAAKLREVANRSEGA